MSERTGEQRLLVFLWGTLVFLFVCAVVGMAFPTFAIVAAFSVIGVPVAILMWISPACFVVLALLLLFYTRPQNAMLRAALAVLATGVVLCLPPAAINRATESEVADLMKGDFDLIRKPLEVSSIAVVERYDNGQKASTCDGICLHFLLSSEAKRFLFARDITNGQTLDFDAEATEFSLQRRESCPEKPAVSAHGGMFVPDKNGTTHFEENAILLLNLKLSEGECLVARSTTLRDADLIISSSRIQSGRSSSLFDLQPGKVDATRTTVYLREQGAVTPTAIFRETAAAYQSLGFALLPVPNGDLNTSWGWMRNSKMIRRPLDDSNWNRSEFFTRKLGFQLNLHGGDPEAQTGGKLKAVLNEGRAPTEREWDAFLAYFDRAIGEGTTTDEEHTLLMRTLANPLFPTPHVRPLFARARALASEGRMDELKAFAAVLIARAERGRTWDYPLKLEAADSLQSLDQAIAELPIHVLKPHFDELDAALSYTVAVENMPETLARLPLLDPKGTKILLDLMEEGMRGGPDLDGSAYETRYAASLKALCRAGAAASIATPYLLVRIGAKEVPMEGKYGTLMASTLVRIGMTPEAVRVAFGYDQKSDAAKQALDVIIKNARSGCR